MTISPGPFWPQLYIKQGLARDEYFLRLLKWWSREVEYRNTFDSALPWTDFTIFQFPEIVAFLSLVGKEHRLSKDYKSSHWAGWRSRCLRSFPQTTPRATTQALSNRFGLEVPFWKLMLLQYLPNTQEAADYDIRPCQWMIYSLLLILIGNGSTMQDVLIVHHP